MSRLIIVLKSVKRDIVKLIHPNSVETLTFEEKKLTEATIKNTTSFLILYIIIIITLIFLISFDEFSFEATINAVFATVANVGLCFEISDFSAFSDFSKIVLSIGMLLGRLEIFPVLVLFTDMKRKN